jgi:hypothetical protein
MGFPPIRTCEYLEINGSINKAATSTAGKSLNPSYTFTSSQNSETFDHAKQVTPDSR